MSFRQLAASSLPSGVTFHRPDHHGHPPVSASSSALEVMTDLKKTTAITVHPSESLDAAQQKMIQKGVRMLLVTDFNAEIIGILTATDVLGERPIQFVERNGGSKKDVRVQDVMTERSGMDALAIKDVSHAKVGDIIETLRHHGRQHALVVDFQGPKNESTVRGIFSLTQIARQLGVQIQTYDVATNLTEIANFMKKNHP